MRRPPPRPTRTDPRFPYTTLFRSDPDRPHPLVAARARGGGRDLAAAVAGRAHRAARPPRRHRFLGVGPRARVAFHRFAMDRRLGERLSRRPRRNGLAVGRSEEHTSELQSLMRISYAVFCLTKKQ